MINNIAQKKTVAFITLGCKLNFAETSGIASMFGEKGYTRVPGNQNADVFVINTCTVTETANKKSRQAINKIIKHNPNAKVVVVGCYSQLSHNEVSKIEGVDLILGTHNKFNVINELEKLDKIQIPKTIIDTEVLHKGFVPTYSFGDRTRCFLKVQDGCNYFCSYCTIPYARGNSRNNSIAETVSTARSIVQKGVHEIILTGVNIGDFGRSTNESFFDLLKQISAIDGLERLRISSIEPNLLTNQIIEYVAKSKNILPHFHIPLQCGTDNLLQLMRRRYTTSFFADKVNFIKSLMPHACIAADLIIGVPGETNDEFNKTLNFIDSIDVSYLHVFTYSERANTPAAIMPNKVPINIRKQRSEILHKKSIIKQHIFYNQHIGTTRKVLFESRKANNLIQGFTDNYINVQVPYDKNYINKIIDVELIDIADNNNINGKVIL